MYIVKDLANDGSINARLVREIEHDGAIETETIADLATWTDKEIDILEAGLRAVGFGHLPIKKDGLLPEFVQLGRRGPFAALEPLAQVLGVNDWFDTEEDFDTVLLAVASLIDPTITHDRLTYLRSAGGLPKTFLERRVPVIDWFHAQISRFGEMQRIIEQLAVGPSTKGTQELSVIAHTPLSKGPMSSHGVTGSAHTTSPSALVLLSSQGIPLAVRLLRDPLGDATRRRATIEALEAMAPSAKVLHFVTASDPLAAVLEEEGASVLELLDDPLGVITLMEDKVDTLAESLSATVGYTTPVPGRPVQLAMGDGTHVYLHHTYTGHEASVASIHEGLKVIEAAVRKQHDVVTGELVSDEAAVIAHLTQAIEDAGMAHLVIPVIEDGKAKLHMQGKRFEVSKLLAGALAVKHTFDSLAAPMLKALELPEHLTAQSLSLPDSSLRLPLLPTVPLIGDGLKGLEVVTLVTLRLITHILARTRGVAMGPAEIIREIGTTPALLISEPGKEKVVPIPASAGAKKLFDLVLGRRRSRLKPIVWER